MMDRYYHFQYPLIGTDDTKIEGGKLNVLKKVDIDELDGIKPRRSSVFSQLKLTDIGEGTNNDIFAKKTVGWRTPGDGSLTNLHDHDHDGLKSNRLSVSNPKRLSVPNIKRLSISNQLGLSARLSLETADFDVLEKKGVSWLKNDNEKIELPKMSLRPNSIIIPTTQTKLRDRMKCKWCYRHCQDLDGKECSDCMNRRCEMASQTSLKTMINKSKKEKKKQCKPVSLRHWDSSIAWNRRIELENRLVQDLVSVEKARRQRSMEMRQNVSVIIVGAGLAGLSVADSLLNNGFKNVTVLEASDRIGGRIHTVHFGPSPKCFMDLGVSVLEHPKEWNSVFTLARTQGLIEGMSALGNVGTQSWRLPRPIPPCHPLSVKCVDRQACFYDLMINHEIATLNDLKYKNGKHTNNLIQLSSKDFFRETLRRIDKHVTRRDNSNKNPIGPPVTSVVEAYCKEIQYQHGDDSGDADIQQFSTNDQNSHLKLKRGMASIIKPLTKLFKPKTLKLKARVNNIDWTDFTPENARRCDEPIVNVTCSDGKIFKAHHLIVTVPLGFLKSNVHSLFNPSLPENKLCAIERLGFGAVSKAFLQYERPVYRYGFYIFLTDGDDDIATESNIEKNIVNITAKQQSCVVQVTFSNSTPEKLKDDDLVRDLTCVLESRLLRKMPNLVKLTRTKWRSNSLYGGTHPFIKVSESQKDSDILAEPIVLDSIPLIQFAGDATYKDYTCLLHGARASGLREAQRLINIYDDLYGLENLNVNSDTKLNDL